MKEVKAFVRPKMITDIYDGLQAEGYCCATITEGEGTGRYSDPRKEFPSLKHPFTHSEIVKIEIVCKPEEVDDIVRIIHEKGTTGYRGDGIITVTEIEKVYSVKTGLSGEEVL